MLDGVEDFEETGDAAGIVVGTVVDVAEWPIAVCRAAVADVIVMRPNDNHLLFELRVAPFHQPQDVARRTVEALKVTASLAGRQRAEPLEFSIDIVACRPSAATPRFAPFERIVS